MLLVAVFVLTNTVSTDGSVGGIYHASLQLAQRTADNATRSSVVPDGVKKLEGSVDDLMGAGKASDTSNEANKNQNQANQNSASPNPESKPKSNGTQPKGR